MIHRYFQVNSRPVDLEGLRELVTPDVVVDYPSAKMRGVEQYLQHQSRTRCTLQCCTRSSVVRCADGADIAFERPSESADGEEKNDHCLEATAPFQYEALPAWCFLCCLCCPIRTRGVNTYKFRLVPQEGDSVCVRAVFCSSESCDLCVHRSDHAS